jgi:phosphoenolpyruvate-protein kinase (PTS system EI component)
VCGEAAADLVVAAALVGLGADELSMTPTAIPEIKDTLRRLDREALAKLSAAAVSADSATDVRTLVGRAIAGAVSS